MSSGRTTAARGLALVAAIGIAHVAAGSEHVAIYTNIPGHPTAQVPGVPGAQFRSPLAPFLTLNGSPIGAHWIFKAFTDNPDSNANDVIVVGSGTSGLAVAKEGDPAPIAGLTYGFMDSDCGINDSGHYVFGNRLSGGPTTEDEVIFRYDGLSTVAAFREGDPAPNLVDPDGAGDELYGNTLNSAHILNDDTAACHADSIQNINSAYQSALYQGTTVVAQEGTNVGSLAGVDVYDNFIALSGNTFSSSADGSSWIVEADVSPTTTDEAVVVNGTIEIRDGDILAPDLASPVDGIFEVDMAGGGDWFARGDLADDRDWVVRNGTVVAATGRPITPGNPELWANVLMAVNGSGSGDYVVIGDTSNPDSATNVVVVLNGQRVIARTGDPVILAGGPEAFIDDFDAFDVFIADDLNDDLVDDREVYVFGALRDAAGAPLADAFIVIRLSCPWDCGDSDGTVGIVDFLAMLAQWGQIATTCDFDGTGVDVVDFLALLANWGPCP